LTPQINQLLLQAATAFQSGNFASAELILGRVLSADKNNFPALSILGLIKATTAQYDHAAEFLGRAEKINPRDPSIQFNLAKVYMESGAPGQALKHYKRLASINSSDPKVWIQIAICNGLINENEYAIRAVENAIALNPNLPDAWYYKGVGLGKLNRDTEALIAYEKTISLDPQYSAAWIGKGVILTISSKCGEAINCFDRAIEIAPQDVFAWYNMGIAYGLLNRPKSALLCYDKCLEINDQFADALFNKGAILASLKDYEAANYCFEQLLLLHPEHDYLLGNLINSKMQTANWDSLDGQVKRMIQLIEENKKVSSPFFALSAFDFPNLHKRVAENWIAERFPDGVRPIFKQTKKNGKIKIAYFSADFREHPVAHLMAELFELHDRNQFEIFAFSLLATEPDDPFRQRLIGRFDHFLNVESNSGQEIAAMARDLEIDIAIDLGGHTENSKTSIFANHAAPIQVNYLGYPGTMGAQYFDYIIADRVIIPETSQSNYVEKIIYLPNTYLVDDSKRVATDRKFNRRELGLPDNAFVFCCFNNAYKFNPTQLEVWAKLLQAIEGSVLWLSENNRSFQENIKTAFLKYGIRSERIVFAGRMSNMADHLARFRVADLFLDTIPYNAHTTALDALKAGLPLITCLGNSFAGRVGASLLNSAGIPELIAKTADEYIALSIKFANDDIFRNQIKTRLAESIVSGPLFKTNLYVKYLEQAFQQIYDRHHSGLAPDHIQIN